jgi:hypothetical protein
MKTPREVLLERHRSAEAGLDAVRRNALATTVDVSRHDRPAITPLFVISKLWQELIWPCRRIWLGLATLWLGVIAFDLMTTGDSQAAGSQTTSSNPMVIMAWKEQRRLMAQLLEPVTPEPVLNPPAPRPRSDRRHVLLIG